jgi:hypothetical protein
MKTVLVVAASGLMLVACAASQNQTAAVQPGDCEGLTGYPLDGGSVTAASRVAPKSASEVAYCRVQVALKPEPRSHILVELWLPEQGRWNGKFLGTGNGGAAGAISTPALTAGVNRGYAVANTDMGSNEGKNVSLGLGFGFGVNRPDLQKDFSYRSTDGMTLVGKAITRAYYGRAPQYAYFQGCSTGGYQAWEQIHRLPGEYDGVVAGAAANDRPNLHMTRIWNEQANLGSAAATIPREKLAIVQRASTAACDELDGAKDGLIGDPRQCKFDPSVLQCKGADAADCLTAPQVETMRKVYQGPTNPRTGERVYWGFERGSEAGIDLQWNSKIGPGGKVLVQNNMVNWSTGLNKAHPDGVGFDFDRDVALVNRDLRKMLNYTDPKLAKFQRAGGKALIYHGWADSLVPAGGTPAYYERIAAANGGYERTKAFARLFMLPGMGHCRGGAGPDQFDALGALEAWVERGQAPEQLMTSKPAAQGRPAMSRPACAYPSVARYDGKGDINAASSFTCQAPAV